MNRVLVWTGFALAIPTIIGGMANAALEAFAGDWPFTATLALVCWTLALAEAAWCRAQKRRAARGYDMAYWRIDPQKAGRDRSVEILTLAADLVDGNGRVTVGQEEAKAIRDVLARLKLGASA